MSAARLSALDRWRGNRRLRRGYCPLCNSSPPDPQCRVCHGSRDYGPYQTDDERERWWVAWHRIIGFPEPATKGLVIGRGRVPSSPPPPVPSPLPPRPTAPSANDLKVAVCEYLLSVNRGFVGQDRSGSPLIPPTAIDWLGDGIVDAIKRSESWLSR